MSLQEGYQFFLYLSDGSRRYGYAIRNTDIKLLRKHYPINDLIGHLYGTVFEVQGKHLIPVDQPLMPVDETDVDVNDDNDNRSLIDDRTHQTLAQEQIEQMKNEGVDGQIILQELATGSNTYGSKTDYSKKKYLRKKAEKYIIRCMLVEANSETVCEQQYMKNPVKLNYLRFDTLGYMLSVSNLHCGQRVMVFDDCMGIIVGSVMERLGGYGLVFAVNKHANHIPAYDCVNRLNFNVIADGNTYIVDHDHAHAITPIDEPFPEREATLDDYRRNIRNTLLIWHISELYQVTPGKYDEMNAYYETPLPLPIPTYPARTIYLPTELYHTRTEELVKHKDGTPMGDNELIAIYKKRLDRRIKEAWQPSMEEQKLMIQSGMHSLIVASNNPLEDVPGLLPYLAPSGILVVYSQYQTLLAELFAGLKRSGQWVNISLTESFMRKYQVLPMRTHPYMNMFNNSGFVLTATRVLNTNKPSDLDLKGGIRTGASTASILRKKRMRIV